MGKENTNANVNFNQSTDVTSLATENVEFEMNVSEPLIIENNTSGLAVGEIRQEQEINQDIPTSSTNQMPQIQADIYADGGREIDVEQGVITDVQKDSKISVNGVNTGETLVESNEDSGLHQTPSVLGEDVSTKREKMDSNSVEHVEVSEETATVGSYSADAKNNAVFGITAQQSMRPLDDRTNPLDNTVQFKKITRNGFSYKTPTKIKLNPEEVEAMLNMMASNFKQAVENVCSSQREISQITHGIQSDYGVRQENFANAFNNFLNTEFHKNELQYAVGNAMLDMIRTQIPDLESIIEDFGINAYNVTITPLKIMLKFRTLYKIYDKFLREKLLKRIAESEALVAIDSAAAAIFDATVVLSPIGIVLHIISGILALQAAIDTLLTFGIIASGSTLMVISFPMTDLDEKIAGNIKGLPTIGKANATGVEDPIVEWMLKHNELIDSNVDVLNGNSSSIVTTIQDMARAFKEMDSTVGTDIQSGDQRDFVPNVRTSKLKDLTDESIVLDENITVTHRNQIQHITQDVINSDEFSDFKYFISECNQLESRAQIQYLIKMCGIINDVNEGVKFCTRKVNDGLQWVESVLESEWVKAALALTSYGAGLIRFQIFSVRQGLAAFEKIMQWIFSVSEEVTNLPQKFQRIEELASNSSSLESRTKVKTEEFLYNAVYGSNFPKVLSLSQKSSEVLDNSSREFEGLLYLIKAIATAHSFDEVTTLSIEKMKNDTKNMAQQFMKIV